MTPLKALVGLVALLFDAFFPSKTRAWPDGEQPLIDPPKDYPPDWALTWTGDEEVSAGSAREARVDAPADEVPTPGRAHTPGVGHPKITASLLISASIGLRDYADSDACEAPVYWRSIASQLDPKATR